MFSSESRSEGSTLSHWRGYSDALGTRDLLKCRLCATVLPLFQFQQEIPSTKSYEFIYVFLSKFQKYVLLFASIRKSEINHNRLRTKSSGSFVYLPFGGGRVGGCLMLLDIFNFFYKISSGITDLSAAGAKSKPASVAAVLKAPKGSMCQGPHAVHNKEMQITVFLWQSNTECLLVQKTVLRSNRQPPTLTMVKTPMNFVSAFLFLACLGEY